MAPKLREEEVPRGIRNIRLYKTKNLGNIYDSGGTQFIAGGMVG